MSENKEISKDMNKSEADQSLAWEEISVEHIVRSEEHTSELQSR